MVEAMAKYVKCPECKKLMNLDDIDYQFKGCQDEYYTCHTCDYWTVIKIRYNHECGKRKFYRGG